MLLELRGRRKEEEKVDPDPDVIPARVNPEEENVQMRQAQHREPRSRYTTVNTLYNYSSKDYKKFHTSSPVFMCSAQRSSMSEYQLIYFNNNINLDFSALAKKTWFIKNKKNNPLTSE